MELILEFFDFVLTAVFYGMLTWFVFTWLGSRYLEHSELGAIARDLDQERLIPLTVEVDNNQYFCYNSITQDFVCQGSNLKEIVERFKLRYPDKSAAIYNGDEAAVRLLKQQMKDLSENFNSIRSTS